MALLREYDVVLTEPPYAINIEGALTLLVKQLPKRELDIWTLSDVSVSAWASRLPDDSWRECKATCYFQSGAAVVPFRISRANASGFSLLHAFIEMAIDGQSIVKI